MGAGASAQGGAVNAADDALEIARLAALPPLDYDRERQEAADRLGCRVGTLDAALKAARGGTPSASNGQGRPLDLHEIVPWRQSVDGALLLDRLARSIRRYVVVNPLQADVVALWVLAAHALDAWMICPRLFVTAPERECGKSTLLDVLSRLLPRAMMASSVTAAALFRTIEAARPSLLLDEADAWMRDNEDLRAVLDAGHRRDGAVIRLVGDDHQPRQFSAWAPVVLAAIGHLPGTIEDRSIIILLRRRRTDEPVQSFRIDRVTRLEALARMAARWMADHLAMLGKADPAMPPGIYNRVADNWRPLLTVAELAGGGWPDRARCAAVELSCRGGDNNSKGVLLLADLRELFDREPSGALFVKEILKGLAERDDRSWSEWGKARKPITGVQIAGLLKPFGIKTNTTVRRGGITDKGYRREWFEDAFARYLTGSGTVTRSQVADPEDLGDGGSVTPDPDVTGGDGADAGNSAACDRVTDRMDGEPAEWTL
jgi:putative DNA primase/helicase